MEEFAVTHCDLVSAMTFHLGFFCAYDANHKGLNETTFSAALTQSQAAFVERGSLFRHQIFPDK